MIVASNISIQEQSPHAMLTTAEAGKYIYKLTSLWGWHEQQAFKPVPAPYPVGFPSPPQMTIDRDKEN